MPANIIVGAQWGDEGKGRIADVLSAEADIVARYAGGDNAGHTVNVRGDTYKLHLVPSGVLHEQARCLLGGGMVINMAKLIEELDFLAGHGVDVSPERVLIANNAHLVTPAHLQLDDAREAALGDEALGTTKRGIGPAYTDKAARSGLRAELLRTPGEFAERLGAALEASNAILSKIHGQPEVDVNKHVEAYRQHAERLAPYVVDGAHIVARALREGQLILCEGAQGSLLDLNFGSYPFVTSSSTVAGGALIGLGFGPAHVNRVVGVTKAFSTRVGAGPLATELPGELGDRLRGTGENPWDEFGTTTGRPRRTGWLDTVVLRYSAGINGLTELALTKLDILSGFDEIKIAVAYDYRGTRLTEMPLDTSVLAECKPVYETLEGWTANISKIRRYRRLPKAARRYVEQIEFMLDLPVSMISVGPERDQIVIR